MGAYVAWGLVGHFLAWAALMPYTVVGPTIGFVGAFLAVLMIAFRRLSNVGVAMLGLSFGATASVGALAMPDLNVINPALFVVVAVVSVGALGFLAARGSHAQR